MSEKKLKQLKNRINSIKRAITISAIGTLGLFSTVQAKDKDIFSDADNIKNEERQDKVKEYLNIVPINSISEIKNSMRNAAEYNSLIDGIIYTQYVMKNPSSSERKTLNLINQNNKSEKIKQHEELHRQFEKIIRKIHEGDYILKQSQYVTANMMAELLCYNQENSNFPLSENIKRFQEEKRNEYYARHYSKYKNNTILAIKSAKPVVAETIDKEFKRTKTKIVEIDKHVYAADLYISEDNKYQSYLLHDTDSDELVTNPEILKKSPIKCNVLLDPQGAEIKNAQNNNINLSFAAYSWSDSYIMNMENINKETSSYSFERADSDYQKVLESLMNEAHLSEEEKEIAQKYIKSQNNDAYDNLTQQQIEEVQDVYKNYSLEQLQQRAKANFRTSEQQQKEQFEKEVLPHLIPLTKENSQNINFQFYMKNYER